MLAGPLRCGLSHVSLRVRLLGESGTAVTGEVGREEAESLSDMGGIFRSQASEA
jgi:hypothetical protein